MKLLFLILQVQLQVHVFHPSQIRMFWKDSQGHPYRTFERLKAEHPTLRFAMNGGMFTPELSPLGLYIENGKILHKTKIVKHGKSNFAIQPQGVFCIRSGRAEVRPIPCDTRGMTYATQSAPMLVINGKINQNVPTGRKMVRNGVGVRADGKVVMIIDNLTFRELAQAFVNSRCVNAMFLDGGVSASTDWGRGSEFGVMVAVF